MAALTTGGGVALAARNGTARPQMHRTHVAKVQKAVPKYHMCPLGGMKPVPASGV
ncbi:MAG: hypothetical protein ACYDA3_10520 [Gaiellaceae bacterium]